MKSTSQNYPSRRLFFNVLFQIQNLHAKRNFFWKATVNQCITRLKSYEYGYGGIAQIFFKLIAENLLVFRGKMWAKMAKEWFHRKRAHIFLFFGTVFSETQSIKNWRFHALYGDAKILRFQWNPPRCFKFLSPNNTWNHQFSIDWVSLNTVPKNKKKMSAFPMKPFFSHFSPYFTSEYH